MKIQKLTTALGVTVLAGALVFGAAAYTSASVSQYNHSQIQIGKAASEKNKTAEVKLQQVAVQSTVTATYQAIVSGYGEVKAAHQLTYSSEVSGRVLSIANEFAVGMFVPKGTVLATIDDTTYQKALTQAKADVAQAKLDLLEEQRQGDQAKLEWKRSGLEGKPESPLVLRAPQLANVQATLLNAEQALKAAQHDVDNTVIRAPFDALVVSRDVEPGSYIQEGTQLATLYSVNRVEIEVPLSKPQWNTLPKIDNAVLENKQWTVSLTSSDQDETWQGYVIRAEQHLTEENRQRSIVIAVDEPLELDKPLYPGAFVQVNIPGASLDNLWELPSSAVSQQGNIWAVDNYGLLSKMPAQIRFAKDGKVYADAAQDTPVANVVKRPLSSFHEQMKVAPVIEAAND